MVSLRGFSGGAVSILQDGVRVSTSTMVSRDSSTWHFEKIEVIKGPASALYGEGALAGVINKVMRKPVFDGNHMDGLLSFSSFDTLTAAGGFNLQLSDTVAVRADAGYMRSSRAITRKLAVPKSIASSGRLEEKIETTGGR